MFSHNSRLIIVICWIALVLGTFWMTGADSGLSLMLLAVALVGPPVVMLALWNGEGPRSASSSVKG